VRKRRENGERRPNPAARSHFDRDYAVFLKMHGQRRELDALGVTRGR
jgi:hypothetical protein